MNEEKPVDNRKEPTPATFSEKLKTIGGLVAVGIGVIAVGALAGYAIYNDHANAATIAGSAGGVIATMVGAYFGVKVGTDQTKTALDGTKNALDQTSKAMDQTKQALDGQRAEAAKAQVYAAHVSHERAHDVVGAAEAAAERVLGI
jgi:hypothetical protein